MFRAGWFSQYCWKEKHKLELESWTEAREATDFNIILKNLDSLTLGNMELSDNFGQFYKIFSSLF